MKRMAIPIFFFVLFLFSCYLMLHTFSYDSGKHQIVLASRVWSDFGAHIPLIRSFSKGDNWPPQYPLFPGEKIRYHFLFYAIVGLMEKVGFRIDWAMNIPSIIGFFALTVLIYYVALFLFERKTVGILAVLFFLFNGTFSFLKFFAINPLNAEPSTLNAFLHIMNFPSFGPWDGSLVTAFWSLNVYTNQRHIALSFAIVLAVFFILLKKRPSKQLIVNIVLGMGISLLLSSLLFMNQPALLTAVIFLGYIFLTRSPTRITLLFAALFSLPWIYVFFHIASFGGQPTFEPGYLSAKPFEISTFALFWFHNLGLHLFLIPLGIILAPKRIRFFFIPLIILFIIPNVFRFSIDMINNHKFFNFFIIIGAMYSAYALVRLVELFPKRLKLISIFILFSSFGILTFSGFIDFMVIKNDYKLVLNDIQADPDAMFIATHTPPKAIILNSTWFYNPASLAGRSIYSGYSFFTWSAGYDTYGREAITKDMYQSNDLSHVCMLLQQQHISFIEVNSQPEHFLEPLSLNWKTLPTVYHNEETGVSFYDTNQICKF